MDGWTDGKTDDGEVIPKFVTENKVFEVTILINMSQPFSPVDHLLKLYQRDDSKCSNY